MLTLFIRLDKFRFSFDDKVIWFHLEKVYKHIHPKKLQLTVKLILISYEIIIQKLKFSVSHKMQKFCEF